MERYIKKCASFWVCHLQSDSLGMGTCLSWEAKIILLSFHNTLQSLSNVVFGWLFRIKILPSSFDQVIESFTAETENWRMKCENYWIGIFIETCS